MEKIQILVPQYNENEDIIKYLLNSIQSQNNIDFKNDISVIIVNDGSNIILSQDFLKKYEYNIEYYINIKNLGPSTTRNIALSHASADYVMFCDADDMFLNNNAIMNIQKIIEEKHFDLLYSGLIVETSNQKYKLVEKDNTWVHGKVVKREFLIKNNILWRDELKVHEDSYFWGLCKSCVKNFYYLEEPFYLYKYNQQSISHNDPDFILKTYSSFIKSRTYLVQELLNRNKFNLAQKYALSGLYKFYFFLNEEKCLDPKKIDYLIINKKAVSNFLKTFYSLIENILYTEESLNLFIKEQQKNLKDGKVIFEKITFNNFIRELQNINENEVK